MANPKVVAHPAAKPHIFKRGHLWWCAGRHVWSRRSIVVSGCSPKDAYEQLKVAAGVPRYV